jgi:type IV pilus assembly protein PilA
MTENTQHHNGFTLLEILLVVAAIGILAGIVIVALNPGRQLGDTRDAQRQSNVTTVLNALNQYAIDNSGSLPSDIDDDSSSYQMLGTAGSNCDSACDAVTTESECADVSGELAPTYVADIPTDPQNGSTTMTGYYVNQTDAGRVTVGACSPEQASEIEVTR